MNSNNLNNRHSFSWLAEEIGRNSTGRTRDGQPPPKVQHLDIPRLPVDFFSERAILHGKHLRALQIGELLGSAARAAVAAVGRVVVWLRGHSAGSNADGPKHDQRKAA